MLQLGRVSDRLGVECIARQIHSMHVAWRPDIYEMPECLFTEERFQAAINARSVYVAKIDDLVCGYVLIKIRKYDWPGVVNRCVLLVDEIGVHEDFRNQGIGTQMMQDVKALAKAYGCTDIQLGVYPQNDRAVSFYQKCGFTIRSIEMQMKV